MSANAYETERYLHEYLLFHYGQPADLCPFSFLPRAALRFHARLRGECLLPLRFPAPIRALDVGCAVGRFTFELGRVADQVVGIDNSRAFIRVARRLARAHRATARVHESGAKFATREVSVPRALRRARVDFHVGDAMRLGALRHLPARRQPRPAALPAGPAAFHIVAAINLLCRLPCPAAFLRQLADLVVPGGQLVVASPYSWLEQYTPRREWLSAERVVGLLRPAFRLARRRDLPFVIREHRRKYQLVVSEVSVFVRE